MDSFPEQYSYIKNKIKVELDLENYASWTLANYKLLQMI